VREEKRHPLDFALWKKAEPEHILRWPSPWGEGFPGWHIECSAMAKKYLGTTFDIHGGGIDNIFPHNECEIAQSEAANDEPFARYWMLTGSLTLDSVKMSKSLGNTLTVKDALNRWRPEAIRTFILTSHYSNPIDFSDEAIEAATKGWQRLWGAVTLVREQLRRAPAGDLSSEAALMLDNAKAAFMEKMDDDFNAPAAVAVLQELTRQVNVLVNEQGTQTRGTLTAVDQLYRELGGTILGIIPDQAESSANAEREDGLVRLLIQLRAEARNKKDWATADTIRNQLKALGVVLEDRADGTIWKLE
jgi:cysteinyl-tRNA synthetase